LTRLAASVVAAGTLVAATLTTAANAHINQRTLAAPGYGGTVNLPNGQPDCLDPQKTGLSASYGVFTDVVDSLVALDKHGHPKADLATHWKIAKGGTQITFFLRQGVKFSNGDPFTAQDVKYTFDRAVDPNTKSPVAAGQLAAVASTSVVNKYTVRITLKTPSRPLFTNLGNAYTGIIDRKAVQSEGDTGFCQKPVGTGPYKIVSTGTAFDTVTLAVNKYHTWEPAIYSNHGLPYIGNVVIHYLSSDATIVSELLSGELDDATVPGTQLSRVKGNPNIKLYYLKPESENWLGFNTTSPPFNNVAVRKAVAEAIDRSALIKAAANGLGLPQYSPLGSGIPYYDKKAKNFLPKLNLSDARKIIAANHATGPYTFLVYAGTTETSTAAEFIQAELAAVGMTVNVVTKPIGDYLSLAGKGQFDMNLFGYGYPDPDVLYLLFDSVNGKGAGLNYDNFVSARLDNDLVKGRTTLAPKKAAAYYNDAQELLNKNVVVVPLYADTAPFGVRSRVHGCCDLNPNAGDTIVEYWVINK
jgi:peptide/nickel transport system substrate-binding protein